MNRKTVFSVLCVAAMMFLSNLSSVSAQSSKTKLPEPGWVVVSPNGRLSLAVAQDEPGKQSSGRKGLYYHAELQGRVVLPRAPLGVTMAGQDGDFVSGLTFVGQSEKKVRETYSMPIGKKSRHVNSANEKTLVFRNARGKVMEVVLRAYDDGIAWRYNFPGKGAARIVSEASAFLFFPGSTGWLQEYKADYEAFYFPKPTELAKAGDYGFPALFHTPNNIWVLVTEAAVFGDYGGCRLTGPDTAGTFRVKIPHTLSGTLPWSTPWRVAIIGEHLGTIVESVMVDNLSPACELNDISWIKPGRVTFPWWSDPKANAKPEKLKTFVDFAADMGWEWIEFDTALIDGSNRGTDTWMTVPWVPKLVEYANARGVSVYGWDHWKNLDTAEKRERVFGLFNKFGIKGIKIDFLNSDSQERFKFRDDAIRDCLKHKLMVSFHGATVPRGRQRRWPHIATWEAVRGAEWYMSWSNNPNPPSYNCTLPFTRNVVGSMDYTPVTFSTDRRGTTDAHELALSVIFESGWQCISDSPQSYNASPGKQFLKQVHAAWDDIHFIDGYPGRFVCLARRKGREWFVAGISAQGPRELTVPLDFIEPGTYSVKLYRDSADGKEIAVEQLTVKTTEGLKIPMAANGGFAVRFQSSPRVLFGK